MKNIIFIVEDAIYANDGYKSRIQMEMNLLSSENVNFIVLAPYSKNKIEFINHVNIVYFKAFSPKIPFVFNKFFLISKLKKTLNELKNPIIICEALPSAVCVYDFCKKNDFKFVFDCHGTAPDEVYLYHKNFCGLLFSHWLRNQEKKVINSASLIVVVSESEITHLKAQNKEYVILPMLPSDIFFNQSDSRNLIRDKLNISSEAKVFVYAGQNQKWQMSKETVMFYKRIEEKCKNTFLLILTRQKTEFTNLCLEMKIKNFCVTTSSYSDMPGYLDACDYGFCLRADHIINRVSSPTKVLEYIARNVRPVITEYVGDYSKILQKEDIGDIVNINEIYTPKKLNDKIKSKQFLEKMMKLKFIYITKLNNLMDQ